VKGPGVSGQQRGLARSHVSPFLQAAAGRALIDRPVIQLTGDRPVPWLTYQQIGERFGLGAEAARTRVRRLGWRTQPGNDGRTLAMVPDDADLRPGGAERTDLPVTLPTTGHLTGVRPP
jgi:hypothetical protein